MGDTCDIPWAPEALFPHLTTAGADTNLRLPKPRPQQPQGLLFLKPFNDKCIHFGEAISLMRHHFQMPTHRCRVLKHFPV